MFPTQITECLHDITVADFIFERTDSFMYLRSILDTRNKMCTDIHFKIKTALTPEIKSALSLNRTEVIDCIYLTSSSYQ